MANVLQQNFPEVKKTVRFTQSSRLLAYEDAKFYDMYHVELKPWMFVVSGVTAIVIALFTICFQFINSAMANPVNSLRNE